MLFGRRDEPTDAVRDYADCLAAALRPHDVSCATWDAEWHKQGWFTALSNLRKQSRAWRAGWVVLHYTALMWSRRGFPVPALAVLAILKLNRCRTVVMFHDGQPSAGTRWIDRFRTSVQQIVIRQLGKRADHVIIPVPLESSRWFSALGDSRVSFIPVGANIPSLDDLTRDEFVPVRHRIPTVAVFGVPTWPSAQQREVHAIVETMRKAAAKIGDLQLLVLGRGAREAEPLVRAGLSGTNISIRVDGVKSGRDISESLASSDVLLFVRGPLTSRRGSGLAGLACGLPIVAYKGRETGFPITDAGIVFGPEDDLHALADELCRVLLDPDLRSELSARNLAAFRKWFAWDRIALQWVNALEPGADSEARDHVTSVASAPRKLLIYSLAFSPSVGGVQSMVRTLVRGLANPNLLGTMECTVVTKTLAASSDSDSPCRIVRNPGLKQLVRLLRDADLVHLSGPAVLPLALSLLFGKPVVVEHHGFQALCPNGLLLYEPARAACPGHFLSERHLECWKCNSGSGYVQSLKLWAATFLRRWLCQAVSANVAPTAWLSDTLRLPRTSVIPHGVPDLPASPPLGSAAPTFLFIGRLVSTKGLDLLLEASRQLVKAGCTFRLIIIGDGPERSRLERQCRDFGIEHAIRFTGHLEEKQIEQYVSLCTAVIMPSLAGEVFGLVAAESMVRGRIAIVPDGGALSEVVADYGLKFAPGDAASLAACMKQVLRSPEVFVKLGERARTYTLANFGADQMVARHLALYEKVLQ